MARKNIEKKYYNQVREQVNAINADNQFYKEISNSIKAGKKQIYQKRIKESQMFDAVWIETIEDYMGNIDKIVRNPRYVMQPNEDIMRIERAKKITSRTIAHLSAHTENVQEIRKDGVIVPSKLLSVTYDDTLITYENRFVRSVIQKLAAFIEIRYNAIKDSIRTYQSDRLNVNSSFNWRNYKIDAQVDLKVTEEIDDELSRKNHEMLARVELLRSYVKGFVNSEFYKELKQAAPVASPILRTNIILKQIDYNACLKLWQFMDSYRELGFSVDTAEKNLDFDEAYEEEIVNMLIYDYSTLVVNQADRASDYHLKPYRFRQEKAPEVVKTLVNESISGDNSEMEAPSANEYFYQKTIEQMSEQYEELIQSGKSYNQSLTTVYKRMQGITNSVYKELFEKLKNQLPTEGTYQEKRKAKYQFTKRKYSVMKSIAWIKQIEAENAQKELVKLEAQMQKYKKLEEEYQQLLKQQRKEALAKARAARKNLPKTEKEQKDNALRVAAMQAARDRARFEKEKREQEEAELQAARDEELRLNQIALEKEMEEKIKQEEIEAENRIQQEQEEKLAEANKPIEDIVPDEVETISEGGESITDESIPNEENNQDIESNDESTDTKNSNENDVPVDETKNEESANTEEVKQKRSFFGSRLFGKNKKKKDN